MKMFLRTLNMLFFIWMMFIFHVKQTDSQVLTLCTNSLTGSQCKLTCTTPDVSQTILFRKMPAASQEGGCAGGTCGATAGRTRYTVTQDAAKNETYLDISSLVYADDDSQWVCDYGSPRSPAVQLTVISLPTLQFDPDPPTADLSQLLFMNASCVYPVSSLTPKLVYQDGQTNSTLDMTYPVSSNNGTNGCGSHEFTVTGSFQLTPTTLSGKRVQFWIEATVAGQVIGSALTTQFFDFPEPTTTTPTRASRVCDQCKTTTIRLGIVGLIFVLIAAVICWVLYCQLSGKCSGPLYERAKDGDKEFTTKKLFWSTVIATVLCLLGFFVCLPGVINCSNCKEGITTSGEVRNALILVIIGIILALIIMIVEIILLVLVCCRKIKIKDSTCQRATPDGQEGHPPTTTESNIRTETSPRPLRDASNDTPRGKLSGVPANRQLPPLAMTDQVDARQKANQLAGVPANRQLPPLATTGQVDASQKANQLEPIENTETKKLKKKKKRRSKEEKAQVISGNSDNEQTDTPQVILGNTDNEQTDTPQVISGNTDNEQTDTNDVLLPNQVGESSPPSCSLPPKVTVQTDHSITRQEPGHEGKEDQTGDSNTNKTHLQDTQGQPNKESKSPDPHEMHENDINQKDRDSDENEHGQNDVKDATSSEYPVKIQSN